MTDERFSYTFTAQKMKFSIKDFFIFCVFFLFTALFFLFFRSSSVASITTLQIVTWMLCPKYLKGAGLRWIALGTSVTGQGYNDDFSNRNINVTWKAVWIGYYLRPNLSSLRY